MVTVRLAGRAHAGLAWYRSAQGYGVGGIWRRVATSVALTGWWTWLSAGVLARICLAGIAFIASHEPKQPRLSV
jgi:hypothetical protein